MITTTDATAIADDVRKVIAEYVARIAENEDRAVVVNDASTVLFSMIATAMTSIHSATKAMTVVEFESIIGLVVGRLLFSLFKGVDGLEMENAALHADVIAATAASTVLKMAEIDSMVQGVIANANLFDGPTSIN